MRSAILVFLCFLTFTFAGAQTLVLSNSNDTYDVSAYIQYSLDLNTDKGIEAIQSNATLWQTFKDGQTPNLGVKKQPYWFTFTLQNNSDKSDWILHIDYQTLDVVSLFVYDTAGKLLTSDVQGILAMNKQKERMPYFTLSLSGNEPVKVFIRVQTSSLLILPVRISTPMAFSKIENAKRNVYLPAWGILIAALLFNLVLLSTSREKAYLFLSL